MTMSAFLYSVIVYEYLATLRKKNHALLLKYIESLEYCLYNNFHAASDVVDMALKMGMF